MLDREEAGRDRLTVSTVCKPTKKFIINNDFARDKKSGGSSWNAHGHQPKLFIECQSMGGEGEGDGKLIFYGQVINMRIFDKSFSII